MSPFQVNWAGIFLFPCIGQGCFFQFPRFLSLFLSFSLSLSHILSSIIKYVSQGQRSIRTNHARRSTSNHLPDWMISKSSTCKYDDTADVSEINRLTDWLLNRHLGNWSPVSKILLQNQACRASQAPISIDDTADVSKINGLTELTTG